MRLLTFLVIARTDEQLVLQGHNEGSLIPDFMLVLSMTVLQIS